MIRSQSSHWSPSLHSVIIVFVISQMFTLASGDVFCRDSWITNMTYEAFSKFTCAKCFIQNFFETKSLMMDLPPAYPYILTDQDTNVTYEPDADMTQSKVCQVALTTAECDRWRSCCQAARDCCLHVQQGHIHAGDPVTCPATWDGIACWDAVPAGSLEVQQCPDYYVAKEVQWLNPQVKRDCWQNGSWFLHPNHGKETSNYSECFDTSYNEKILKISVYVDITGNCISLLFLLTAIVIIVVSRDLRRELHGSSSLQLHFNLFVSVILLDVCTVALAFVYLEALSSDNPVYMQNTVWCRMLNFFSKYFRSTTYMCMFCEGLYLYRRISNVMNVRVTESLVKYFVISWVLPAVTVTLYAVLRVVFDKNKRCWIDEGFILLEFLHVLPNLLSLGCNFVFLLSIERTLCTKMRADPSDRRVAVLRHALRATLSLIPIFGLQFLFILYRTPYWPPYEIISAVFTSTQGFFVATLYCFSNREVRETMRRSWRDLHRKRRQSRHYSTSTITTRLPRISLHRPSLDGVFRKHRKPSRNGINGAAMAISSDTGSIGHQEDRRGSNFSYITQRTSLGSATSIHLQNLKPEMTPPNRGSRSSLSRPPSDDSSRLTPEPSTAAPESTDAAMTLLVSTQGQQSVTTKCIDCEKLSALMPIKEIESPTAV